MAKKRFTPEQIIQHLRTAELEKSKGVGLDSIAKKIGVCTQTLVRWQNEFGGMRIDQAKRLRELEQENSRLKRLVADKELDILILKEVTQGNF